MNSNELAAAFLIEIARQDQIHPPGFPATRDGLRLGLAAIEDETNECLDEWRANRRQSGWGDLEVELWQVAGICGRLIRSLREAAS